MVRRSRLIHLLIGKVIHGVLIAVVLVWTFFPLYWVIVTSFRPEWEVLMYPSLPYPLHPTLMNYVKLMVEDKFYIYILNSLVVSLGATIISLLIGSLAAYALVRIGVPRFVDSLFLTWVLVVRMLPPIVLAIPLFMVLRTLGLIDTRFGLMIAYQVYTLPYVVWILLGFFREIPREIEEAALIDGASRVRVWTSIILPLALPGLIATMILSVILTWNEFLYALVFINSPEKYTVTVRVATYIYEFKIEWGRLAASGLTSALPVLLLSLYVQKYMIRGLAFGRVLR
ncbi:MAG: carbohydrate ABC transporter permease [Thermoprotei archaeon]|nr:MAG: carbohydrate ABC transporter permease [Thermoprotei archaeon]RLE56732.1 MAG: carbohydrate ABC transporter permease [Thermoprotei archaeon]